VTTKWEYCVAAQVPSGPLLINVTTYTPEGARTEQHRTRSYDDGQNRLWPQVIAALGRDGWELVTVEAGAWHFKRPLTEG
jgi:hypothetical protein